MNPSKIVSCSYLKNVYSYDDLIEWTQLKLSVAVIKKKVYSCDGFCNKVFNLMHLPMFILKAFFDIVNMHVHLSRIKYW